VADFRTFGPSAPELLSAATSVDSRPGVVLDGVGKAGLGLFVVAIERNRFFATPQMAVLERSFWTGISVLFVYICCPDVRACEENGAASIIQ